MGACWNLLIRVVLGHWVQNFTGYIGHYDITLAELIGSNKGLQAV